jgi:hypothetical protein
MTDEDSASIVRYAKVLLMEVHPEGFDVPVIPNIDAAILAAVRTPGNCLDMVSWHTCATAHCRAGWAIELAGDAGRKLEEAVGAAAAGILIYAASRPEKPIPNFYCTDEEALADLELSAASAQDAAV